MHWIDSVWNAFKLFFTQVQCYRWYSHIHKIIAIALSAMDACLWFCHKINSRIKWKRFDFVHCRWIIGSFASNFVKRSDLYILLRCLWFNGSICVYLLMCNVLFTLKKRQNNRLYGIFPLSSSILLHTARINVFSMLNIKFNNGHWNCDHTKSMFGIPTIHPKRVVRNYLDWLINLFKFPIKFFFSSTSLNT